MGRSRVVRHGHGSARYLRATLFPAGRTVAGEPDPPTALDRVVRIDPLAMRGVDDEYVFLPLDCAGFAPDLGARTSCPSTGGAPMPIEDAAPWSESGVPARVGTWHGDYARPCAGGDARPDSALHDGEACIAGGVFWMGDFRWRGQGVLDGVPEHAVAVSPFLLDRYEYTVGRYRAALASGFHSAFGAPRTDANSGLKWCSWSSDAADGSRDRLPLNCLTIELARELCAWDEGRRLPTEAEWEWAAGSREHEWLYPWGNLSLWPGEPNEKRAAEVGTHPRDRTADGIVDMSINVSEVVEDTFDAYVGPCWAPGAYGPDPQCTSLLAPDPSLHTNRGGYYGAGSPGLASAVARLVTFGIAAQMGFRCARDGK